MNTFDINNLVRENVKQMKPYSSARDEFEDFDTAQMIFLDANENPFENGVNRYPDPHQGKLKAILSEIKGISTKNKQLIEKILLLRFLNNKQYKAVSTLFKNYEKNPHPISAFCL